jgi:hypothetical protein
MVQCTLFNRNAFGYPLGQTTKGPTMLRPATLTLCLILTVSGCARLADSRLNPLNWFGRSTAVAATTPTGELRPLVPEGRRVQVVDGRVLIDTIADMSVDRNPGGAILRATGVAATQGFYNAQLVLRSAENGVLTYDFRVEAPAGFEAIGTEASRRITAAVALDDARLAGVRRIVVQGARNARTSGR